MRDLLYLKIQVQIGSKQIRIQSLLLEPHVCFLSRSPSNSTIDCTQSVRPVFNWTPQISCLYHPPKVQLPPTTQGAAFTRLALGVPNSFPEPSVSNMRKALWEHAVRHVLRSTSPDRCPGRVRRFGCVFGATSSFVPCIFGAFDAAKLDSPSWIFSGVF